MLLVFCWFSANQMGNCSTVWPASLNTDTLYIQLSSDLLHTITPSYSRSLCALGSYVYNHPSSLPAVSGLMYTGGESGGEHARHHHVSWWTLCPRQLFFSGSVLLLSVCPVLRGHQLKQRMWICMSCAARFNMAGAQ